MSGQKIINEKDLSYFMKDYAKEKGIKYDNKVPIRQLFERDNTFNNNVFLSRLADEIFQDGDVLSYHTVMHRTGEDGEEKVYKTKKEIIVSDSFFNDAYHKTKAAFSCNKIIRYPIISF